MSIQVAKMADEAFATGKMPPGFKVIAGYLFSTADYHPWTAADWGKFPGVKKLPIFIPPFVTGGTRAPEADAFRVLRQLYDLRVPKRTVVALDLETVVDPAYVTDFHAVLSWFRYFVWPYGSASTVFGNPQCDGYWVADYANKGPFMYPHPGVRATQYANGSSYDSSEVKWWQYINRLRAW